MAWILCQCIDIDKKDFVVEGTEIIQCDQNNKVLLNNIANKYGKFDIIIDDGSHISKHIINTFDHLFDHLNQNGLYIVEDLQTSYIPRYGGSRINLNKKKYSMNFFKKLSDSVHFYQNIVFIFKGESKKYFHPNVKTKYLDFVKKLISFFFR